jgi:hypothetical protein
MMFLVRDVLVLCTSLTVFYAVSAQELPQEQKYLSDSEAKQIINELQAKWNDQQQAIKTAEFTIKSHTNGRDSLKKLSADEVQKFIHENSKKDSPDKAFRQIILDL